MLEESPKWAALKEILEEIKQIQNDNAAGKSDEERTAQAHTGRVVIAAQDEKTCSQLREVSSVFWLIRFGTHLANCGKRAAVVHCIID